MPSIKIINVGRIHKRGKHIMDNYDTLPANFYTSTGILKYFPNKLILEIDQGIVDYYRWFIPKSIKINRQMYPAHISVVRKENPGRPQVWGKYEGKAIEFIYSNIIYNCSIYFWLNVYSKELEKIRLELGLPIDSIYSRPPDGAIRTFHITIGNLKNL
jgi:hypothetical protein